MTWLHASDNLSHGLQTPRAPPPPVAAMLSPILWQLNNPDRFDMYSVGVLLLQMAMPALRTDSALINFRRKLESCKYDLNEWRRQQVPHATTFARSARSSSCMA